MKKLYVTLINEEFGNRQNLFLKDPKSDLFVIVHEKIYALHKDYLNEIEYFNLEASKNEKVSVIDTTIDEQHFLMLIGYFYGKELKFTRDWSIEKLLHAIQFLNIPCLENKLHSDIKNNFDEYGFFLLLSLAYKFKIKWLKEQCEEDLIMMGFEQLNYNRYDLFQVEKEVLEEIIRLHEVLKINKDIVGLRDSDLRRILNEYCKTNNVDLEISEMLSLCETSTYFTKVLEESDEENEEIRKRTSTWDENKKGQLLNFVDKRKSLYSCTVQKVSEDQTTTERQIQLNELTNWSSKINEKGNLLIAEIKDMKNEIYNDFESQNNEKIETIDEKFKKITEVCQEQDTKFSNLKNEMEKMSPINKRSCTTSKKLEVEKDLNENVSKLSKSSETNDSSAKIFSRMPQLNKEFDD